MPLRGAGGKLGGGEPVKARVVVEIPSFDDSVRVLKASDKAPPPNSPA